MMQKTDAAKIIEQVIVDFANMLPTSARAPTHRYAMQALAVLQSEAQPAVPVDEAP